MKIDEQTKKKAQKLKKGQNNFFYFSKNIFGESFDNFVSGDYVKECCRHLQNNDRSMRLAFRSGFKSTSFYSFVLWKIMYEGSQRDLDIRYFSYNQKMAAHHIQEIKRLMKTNPYFEDFNDYKPQADNILEGSWTKKGRKGSIIKLRPVGIVSFSRGLKSDLILCVPPNTRIDVKGGSKQIKNIEEGDLVKTHKNRFRKVTEVYEKKSYEKMIKIKTKFQELSLSYNHPILKNRQYPKGGWAGKKWAEARKLQIDDILQYPYDWKRVTVEFSSKTEGKVPPSLSLSADLAWLFGLYAAEGSTSGNRICFSFGKESKLKKRAEKIINEKFKDLHITKDNSKDWETNLFVNSKSLRDSFARWFGEGAPNKKIPHHIFKTDIVRKANFILGLMEGDGKIEDGVMFSVTSKQLRDDLIKLLRSMSISPSEIGEREPSGGKIDGRKIQGKRKKYCCYIKAVDWRKIQTLASGNRRIQSLKKTKANGKLYNLEVEDDNSYIANGFVVHNCDDIYADPENPISPTAVLKVNDIFRGVITESVNREGEIHFCGTPMSRVDAVFDPDIQEEFNFKKFPAIRTNEQGEEIPTWPEYYTLKEIKDKISVMGEKRFQKEIMVSPVHSEDAFFKKENLRKEVVNSDLNNIPLEQGYETPNLVVAGWDLGKKKHPSSFAVFRLDGDKAIMLHHKFMKWPYYTGEEYDPLNPSQLEYCNRAIKNFGINTVYFDATRGELEGAKDLGILPTTYQGVVFNAKKKVELANEFEKTVINNRIELLEDEEMLKSICSMTNELKAVESGGQHADAFVSISLALIGLRKMNASSGSESSTGDQSIFSEESRIPSGW